MANTRSRIGIFTIGVDGEWDMGGLRAVSQGLSEACGLFYPLVAQDEGAECHQALLVSNRCGLSVAKKSFGIGWQP